MTVPVIFPDVNISPAYFARAQPNTLFVRTIFYTIQGEGPFAGRPAVFVRLGGCNLGAKGVGAAGCEWCDTDFRTSHSTSLPFSEIVHIAIEQMAKYPNPSRDGNLFVITGGEPMLQKNLVDFVQYAITMNWGVQIETNGLYALPFETVLGTIVVSPKLGSRKVGYQPLKASIFNRADCLKFVLEDDSSSPYYRVPDYAFTFPRPVYVSPLAVYKRAMSPEEGERANAWDTTLLDHQATARNYRYAAEYALTHGLRISIQQHLFLTMP